MISPTNKDIAFVGYGNVATHLARALAPRVGLVAGRSYDKARELAEEIGAEAADSLSTDALKDYPYIIISIADKALDDVVAAIGHIPGNPLVMHTSGTLEKERLLPLSENVGILYPLQTFSRDAKVDISAVPFFTEASDETSLAQIDDIAASMARTVLHADGAHRGILHIAGVFSSNFTNILLEAVQDILATGGYDLSVVEPLVHATVDKAFALGPHDAQTGPARRGDKAVMACHMEKLPADLREIYASLSGLIMKSHGIK